MQTEPKAESPTLQPPETDGDRFAITVSAGPLDDQPRVLRHQETFALFNRYGDIHPRSQKGEAGLYHDGTRFLNRQELSLDGHRPLLLGSGVDEDNVLLTIDLTNPDLARYDQIIPHGAIHILRSKLLLDGICLEEIRISHYESRDLQCTLRLDFGSDFSDVFEVRGMSRPRRGETLPARVEAQRLTLAYAGLDGIRREVVISATPRPSEVSSRHMAFQLALRPKSQLVLAVTIQCRVGSPRHRLVAFEEAELRLVDRADQLTQQACRIETSNGRFNRWINRSFADLFMMLSHTRHGLYPYAGVPWYNTVFGRDGIITALQLLWAMPDLAKGVLAFLAAHQCREVDPSRDGERGKIVHEMRGGEMAALGEIPFGLYYGSVDATPLFVVLATRYFFRTGDRDFLERLWPHIEAALEWMRGDGDRDHDGFVEYHRRGETGLIHQGWKDSKDSVFHADGILAEPPIALCEVQSYVYAALRGAAGVARALRRESDAQRLRAEAHLLRERFHKAFWLDDLQTYAMALDGAKRPCRVRTSNAAHCLFGGIAPSRCARRIADGLVEGSMFSGWGVRTVDSRESRYNPISYHNGSVWPHDNSLIAAGLGGYGFQDAVHRVFAALFDVSTFVELNRLPELICGFARRRAQGPTLYPVACSPQAWASGAVFMMLQACLSLRMDGLRNRVIFNKPTLPPFLDDLVLYNLRLDDTSLDVRIHRHNDVGIGILRKSGNAEVIVRK